MMSDLSTTGVDDDDEKDKEINALKEQLNALSNQLNTALQQQQQQQQQQQSSCNNLQEEESHVQQQQKGRGRRFHPLSPHATQVKEVVRNSRGKTGIATLRQRMGRTASISTQQVLDSIPDDHYVVGPPHMQRIQNMFTNPSQHIDYLNSTLFGKDVYKLASKARSIFEKEPRVLFVQSPAYVFGDIHGNLEDLHFFSDNVWRLGMNLTAGNFLFLGDYVDRGLHCLECLAYLFMMKIQLPNKVFLLRGNHETRDVNGWEEHYADRSFIYQCRSRFGDDIGYRIWEICNQAFDRLPLAAVIDQDIFCVHGGIPRPVNPNHHPTNMQISPSNKNNNNNENNTSNTNNQNNTNGGLAAMQGVVSTPPPAPSNVTPSAASSGTTRIQDILSVPKVAGINPPYEHEDEIYQQVASDCIWSDPASEDQELTTVDPDSGFGESLRGGGAICFGNKAVTQFLQQERMSFIMRAHEAHAEGVAVCKGARVFTVFSTSKDHNQGEQAMAGCMLVDNDKLQVINRSPAYKNQYVHRRDSLSVSTLSDLELQKRMKLGLVTEVQPKFNDEYYEDDDDEEEDSDDEQWEEFVDDTKTDKDHHHDIIADGEDDDDDEDRDHEGDEDEENNGETNKYEYNTDNGIQRKRHSHRDNNGEEYVIDKTRRSSVDVNSLSDLSYASNHSTTNDWGGEVASERSSASCDELAMGGMAGMGIGGDFVVGGGGNQPVISNSILLNHNKRPRPRREPSVASIYEGDENGLGQEGEEEEAIHDGTNHSNTNEDEEIETVNGEEQHHHQDMELHASN